jgi:hypothetical protein
MNYFDYVFYRIHAFYTKKKYIPVTMGIFSLLVLQCSLLFLFVTILNVFTENIVSSAHIQKNIFYTSYYLFLTLFFVMNVVRYGVKKKPSDLRRAFEGNTSIGKIPLWLIFAQPILFLLLSFVIIGLVQGFK